MEWLRFLAKDGKRGVTVQFVNIAQKGEGEGGVQTHVNFFENFVNAFEGLETTKN